MSRLRRSLGTIPMLLTCLFLLFVSMTNIGQQRDADDDARHRNVASGAVVSVFLGGVGFIAIQLSALVWVPSVALTISVGALLYAGYQWYKAASDCDCVDCGGLCSCGAPECENRPVTEP